MYGLRFALGLDDHMTRNESTPVRMRRDHNDECQVLQCLQRFKVFSTNKSPINTLHNIATKNLATEDIKEYLVNAERLDQKQLHAFFQEIFISSKDHNTSVRLVMAYDAERMMDLPRILRHEI